MPLTLSTNGPDERLFIDHIDTDWSFRGACSSRHAGACQAVFRHRMGSAAFVTGSWMAMPTGLLSGIAFCFEYDMAAEAPLCAHGLKFWAVAKLD